jgi:hypothetical protein
VKVLFFAPSFFTALFNTTCLSHNNNNKFLVLVFSIVRFICYFWLMFDTRHTSISQMYAFFLDENEKKLMFSLSLFVYSIRCGWRCLKCSFLLDLFDRKSLSLFSLYTFSSIHIQRKHQENIGHKSTTLCRQKSSFDDWQICQHSIHFRINYLDSMIPIWYADHRIFVLNFRFFLKLNSCDTNVSRCIDIIELNARVQRELFKLLNLVSAEGKYLFNIIVVR